MSRGDRDGEGHISLTTTSFLVLGLLAQRGPSTPYELKRAVNSSIGYFWVFPHAQFYGEPARLATAGLVEEDREETGRRRRTFTITAAGRAALAGWLSEPSTTRTEIRDLGLLKLFFGDQADPEDVVALARAQEQAHRLQLAEYEALDASVGDHDGWAHPRATLRLGLEFERLAARYWQGIAERPPSADERDPATQEPWNPKGTR